MLTRYVAYARVSTSEQAERGKSIEDQLAKLAREAGERGGVLVGSYSDPGCSGSTLARPQLTSMLAFCKEGGADAVLVVDTDRLARKTEHHFAIKAQLKRSGVRVESLNQPMIDDTPEGVFLDTIRAATNALYPQITGRKTSLSMSEKASAGWWPGPARLGYRNADNPAPTSANDRRILIAHDVTGPLVTRAFTLYARGEYSLYSLCAEMERLGLRSVTGGKVTKTSMRKMLGDTFYISRAPYKGVVRNWKHVPLTDEETFLRCGLVLAQHNHYADRMRKHEFLLSGLVTCGQCGAPYTASVNAPKGKAYYHCPLNRTPHSNVGQNVLMDILDAQAEVLFTRLAFGPDSVDRIIARARAVLTNTHGDVDVQRRELMAQRAKLENRRDRMEERFLDGEITQETYRRQSVGTEEALTSLGFKLARLDLSREANIAEFEQLMRLSIGVREAYAAAPLALRRRYLSLFWEKIVVRDRQIVEAVPSKAFAVAVGMAGADTKTPPRLYAAGEAEQIGMAVIKSGGWLPNPSEFITLLRDTEYWNHVRSLLN